MDKQVAGEQVAGEQVAGEQVASEQVTGEQVAGEQLAEEQSSSLRSRAARSTGRCRCAVQGGLCRPVHVPIGPSIPFLHASSGLVYSGRQLSTD